jgi:hemerythrin-like domain-containing protein
MRISEIIKIDHDKFRQIIARLEATTEKDSEFRKQQLPHFMRILDIHHSAEEEILFPLMEKNVKLKETALDLIEEHRAMLILLDDLLVSGQNFKFWRPRFRPFQELIGIHLLKEETVVVPYILTYFSEAEIEDMGERFYAAQMRNRNSK